MSERGLSIPRPVAVVPRVGLLLGFGGAVFGAAMLSDALRPGLTGEPSCWMPSGLAVSAMVVATRRRRPAYLAAAVLTVLAAGAVRGEPVEVGAARAVALVAEACAFGLLVSRAWGDVRTLDTRRAVLRLFAAAALCATAGATVRIGVEAGVSAFPPDAGHAWAAGSVADAIGILALAPPILLWRTIRQAGRRAALELVGAAGMVACAVQVGFEPNPLSALEFPYVPLAVLLFAVVRLGWIGAATLPALPAGLSLWHTKLGNGPWAHMVAAPFGRVLAGQAYALTVLTVPWLIAAIERERETALSALASDHRTVERRVARRTAELAEQTRHAHAAAAVSHALSEAELDETTALATIAGEVVRALGDGCVVAKLSADRDVLAPFVARAVDEALERALQQAFFPLTFTATSQGLTGRAILSGSVVRVGGDVERLVAVSRPELTAFLTAHRVHSVLIAPMRARGAVLGTITLLRGGTSRSFTDGEMGFLQDLADRAGLALAGARLHERVRSIEQRYRALAEADVIGVISGEEDRVVEANDAFLRMVGHPRAALERGELTVATLTPAGVVSERRLLELVRRAGHAPPFERVYRRGNGGEATGLVTLVRLQDAPFRWVATVLDVSDRKRTHERLQRFSEQQAMLADCSRLLQAVDVAAGDAPGQVGESVAKALEGACQVLVVADRGLVPAALACSGDEGEEAGAVLRGQPDGLDVARRVLAHGEPELAVRGGDVRVRLVFLPLRIHNRTLGVIALAGRLAATVGRADVAFLQEVADRAALTLDNARLAEAERAAQTALRESEHQRRRILASMLQAEEAERTRIATALHDDTVQVMTASLLALDRLPAAAGSGDSARLADAAVHARAILAQATERTRRLMFELRPTVLHDYGVAAAARVLLEQTARETGAATELTGCVGRYHLVLEEAIYRGIQEALANIRKHAGATRISIGFAERHGMLVCEVVDNGRGFDLEETRARPQAALHIGLPSVVERVRAAGGDVVIASTPGAGTRVKLAIPIERRAARPGAAPG